MFRTRHFVENSRRKKSQAISYEFCPNCEANLTLQKGYSSDLPYWVCRGCGKTLVNPSIELYSGVTWICDKCGAMLNIQEDFSEFLDEWECTECGHVNSLSSLEIYESEDEFKAAQADPYKGLSDDAVLELLFNYTEGEPLDDNPNTIVVRDLGTRTPFVKKLLEIYDISVYSYLKEHPIAHMPRIIAYYEGDNRLVVIEEYIEGKTLEEQLSEGPLPQDKAIDIIKQLCTILNDLHHLHNPIIHRDIKPSNIIISSDGTVYLLDMNIAKWYDPDRTDDTHHMGTEHFAAPEQAGYGMKASSPKSDIYAIGMLLNVMLTGHFPKEEMPDGPSRKIIERCISLDAESRYTARELLETLNDI